MLLGVYAMLIFCRFHAALRERRAIFALCCLRCLPATPPPNITPRESLREKVCALHTMAHAPWLRDAIDARVKI